MMCRCTGDVAGCLCCMRFGPTAEEAARQADELREAEMARISAWIESPVGLAAAKKALAKLQQRHGYDGVKRA